MFEGAEVGTVTDYRWRWSPVHCWDFRRVRRELSPARVLCVTAEAARTRGHHKCQRTHMINVTRFL